MLKVGMRHDCGEGWCVCIAADPYGRDDLVSIRVTWDDPNDEFDPVTMQHTIGIDPSDVHYYRHAVQTFEGCAKSADHGRHLVQREMDRVARVARQQRQSEALWKYRQQQAEERKRQSGETARSLYAEALREGNATKAKWIRENWSRGDFLVLLQSDAWKNG